MSEKTIIGIGLLLFSGHQIMTVRELEDKPLVLKRRGMLSFPLETVKGTDRSHRNTVMRLLKEELGIFSTEVEFEGMAPKEFRLIPGMNNIHTLYGIARFVGNPHRTFSPEDTDIEIVGWKSPAELLNENLLRIEVAPILADFAVRNKEEFVA